MVESLVCVEPTTRCNHHPLQHQEEDSKEAAADCLLGAMSVLWSVRTCSATLTKKFVPV